MKKHFIKSKKLYEFLESFVTMLKLTNNDQETDYSVYKSGRSKDSTIVIGVLMEYKGYSQRFIFIEHDIIQDVFVLKTNRNSVLKETIDLKYFHNEESVIEFIRNLIKT